MMFGSTAASETETLSVRLNACDSCIKNKKKCTGPGALCDRCKEKGFDVCIRIRVAVACEACYKSKKKCDGEGVGGTCSRCLSSGIPCIFKEIKTRKKKVAPSKPKRPKDKPETNVPTVGELVLTDGICDEIFTLSLMQTFVRSFGVMFTFATELDGSTCSVTDLYSGPATQVRADAILSCASRGAGLVREAEFFFRRAKMNSEAIPAGSDEKFSALTMLGVASLGGDSTYSRSVLGSAAGLIGHDVSSRSIFEIITVLFMRMLSPVAAKLLAQLMTGVYRRVLVKANHVRDALLAAYGKDHILSYGPLDWVHFLTGNFDAEVPPVDATGAQARLVELLAAEERLQALKPELAQRSPELWQMGVDRFHAVSLSTKSVLNLIIGDLQAARRNAELAFERLSSTTSMVWFAFSVIDVVHLIDVALEIGDEKLLTRGMILVKRMSPLVPVMALLEKAMGLRKAPNVIELPVSASFKRELELLRSPSRTEASTVIDF